MKAFGKAVLPRAVGVIFIIYPAWMFYAKFTTNLLLEIPIYLILTSQLFKRNRGYPLAAAVAALALVRLLGMGASMRLPNAQPFWWYLLGPYLAGEALLTAFVLMNAAPPLKRFRIWGNRLWFLPGAVMLASPAAAWILFPGRSALQLLQTLEVFGCGPLLALAALLLPLWLVCSAEDDLLEYVEAMRGFHTPEELEEKRRELGLPDRKRK